MAESSPSTNLNQVDLASLVAEHHAVLYRYALRLSGSTTDAEDLTQQTFLTAQTSLFSASSAGLRDANSARAWLFTVLRNGFLKSRRRLPPLPAADLELDINSVSDPDAEDLNFWEQRGSDQTIDPERLQLALDELPPDFKLVVLMFYFEELSYKQIAEHLALPIGTVMSRLSRAKQHIRGKMIAAATDRDGPLQHAETRKSAAATTTFNPSNPNSDHPDVNKRASTQNQSDSDKPDPGSISTSNTDNNCLPDNQHQTGDGHRVAEVRFHS
jgi:RNA polymerase sigma-70 factor (ECF subfamily)